MAWHIPHQKANTSRGVQRVIFDMTCVLHVPYVLGGIYVCQFLPLSLLCSLCREEEAVHRHSIPSRTAMLPFIGPIATSQRRRRRRTLEDHPLGPRDLAFQPRSIPTA